MRRTLVLLLVLATCTAAAQQQAPARDAVVTPTFGGGAISGTVVNDEDQPHPVRRAVVTLSGAGLVPNRGAITDDDGRFTLTGLPAGRFTLTVMRASFITSVYGAKRPGRPGTAIAVGDGQAVTGLVARLWRGAAIGGVVRDEKGVPVPNIPITATSARPGGNAGILTLSNNGATTDNLGEFRIFGLEPGTYVVSAKPSSGSGAPLVAPSEAEIDALLAAVRSHSSQPSPAAAQPAPQIAAKPFDYAPVYFPGTPSLSQATPVTLVAGQELTGLEFSLQRISTSVVQGVVTRPDGSPAAGATLQMMAVMPATFAASSPLTFNATAGPDGIFRIAQVTPGDYKLVVRAPLKAPPPSAPGAPQGGGGFVSPGGAEPSLYAQTDIPVSGSDVTGLALQLEPGLTVAGRVTFSGTTKVPADLPKIQVWLKSPGLPTRPGAPINTIAFVRPSFARADGTFEITNVVPGPYQLTVTMTGPDADHWWPASAMMGERDLLEGQTEIARGSSGTAMVVTFTDRHSELSGTLQTANGAPASDVFVIAYAADRKFWGVAARRVRAVRPDADGHYSIKDLPPGEYKISAVTDVDQDDWQDPGFLDKLIGTAISIAIADGEKKVQSLTLGGG